MTGNLSKELLEKAMGARSKEEVFEILRQGGVILTDDDLQKIASGVEGCIGVCGGNCDPNGTWCPRFDFRPSKQE